MIERIPYFAWVPLVRLQPGHYQPRLHFNDAALQELALSISKHGILQPLLVTDNYHIIAGERRYRAARMLGLEELPCMVLQAIDSKQALLALLENIQREQMEPLEEAKAYRRLRDEFSWTQQHMAELLGKSRAHVANMMRLLSLCEPLLEALSQKRISYGHARVLVGLKADIQKNYLTWIEKNKASVRQLEKKCQLDKKNKSQKLAPTDDYFSRMLAEQVGTSVHVDNLPNGEGWLKFKFFNQDTLLGLLERLGLSYDNEMI